VVWRDELHSAASSGGARYRVNTIGKLENWKTGRLEDWKTGRLEDWKIGNLKSEI
jgi:hypothetical protein